MTAEVGERPGPEVDSHASHLRLERVVAGAALVGGLGLVAAGVRYGVTGPTGVGPGTFPAAAGALMVLSSLLQVRNLLPERDSAAPGGPPATAGVERSVLPDRAGALRVATVVAATLAAAVVLDRIGFVFAVGLYLVVVLKVVGHRTWVRSAVVGMLIALLIGQVFSRGLDVSLPTTSVGFLEDLGI